MHGKNILGEINSYSDNAHDFSPPDSLDENDTFHLGTFDAACGNFAAPSGRGSPFHSLALNMLTETQKIEMPSHFLQRYNAGMIDEALTYLRENWLIYPHLPTWALDDEQISEIAISQHSYLSWRMSERLQRDIRFFEKVFNQFSPYTKIALETGRDTFFMLAYGNAVHGYSKAATKSDVSALFPAQDTDYEYSLAKQLIAETAKWREWHLSDKDDCSHLLSEAVPGLASFSYEYAYYWGYRNLANDQRAQFC